MSEIKFFASNEYTKGLNFGSPTQQIAQRRNAVYNNVMGNVELIRNKMKGTKMFSSSVDMQGSELGVALKEASIKAYLDSFAGYIAVEASLSQMTQVIVYKDMVTKGTNQVTLPMIGAQNPRSGAQATKTHTIPVATAAGTVDLNSAVVPGTIMIIATINGATSTIVDDRKGNLLGQGNVLKAGVVDYNTGKITYETAVTPVANDKFIISFSQDVRVVTDATPNKRIKPRQGSFLINAQVNSFEYEFDVISNALATKTLGSQDLGADMQQAVKDEHLMWINNQLVRTLVDNYAHNTLTIDLSSFSVAAGMYDSLIRVFNASMTSVDTALAKRTWKVVAATSYVVGTGLSDLFNSMKADENWVPNNTGFINGLVGFYKGRAVLRHNEVDPWTGYAIHKTPDGELAPVGLGILLPATDLPLVGNFNGTHEVAGGIYSAEGVSNVTGELVQAFKVKMPSDWIV